jgi:hypothetical protein
MLQCASKNGAAAENNMKGRFKARFDFGGRAFARCVKDGGFFWCDFNSEHGKARCKGVKEGVEYFAVTDGTAISGTAIVFNIEIWANG